MNATALLAQVKTALAAGDPAQAQALALSRDTREQHDAALHLSWADLLEELGLIDEVLKELHLALRDDPENAALYPRLADLYQDLGRPDRAAQVWAARVKHAPQDAEAYRRWSDLLQEAGEPLRLRYKAAPYGPYAENLRHVLHAIEGHLIAGYDDGGDAPDKPLTLVPGAVEEAAAFLAEHRPTRDRHAHPVICDGSKLKITLRHTSYDSAGSLRGEQARTARTALSANARNTGSPLRRASSSGTTERTLPSGPMTMLSSARIRPASWAPIGIRQQGVTWRLIIAASWAASAAVAPRGATATLDITAAKAIAITTVRRHATANFLILDPTLPWRRTSTSSILTPTSTPRRFLFTPRRSAPFWNVEGCWVGVSCLWSAISYGRKAPRA